MPTSLRALNRRGFTLIELSVVVLVIVLITAIIVPRLSSFQRGVDAKLNMAAVQRLASRARESAMSSGRPVSLAFESTDSRFELRSENADGDSLVSGEVQLHEDFQAQRFFAGNTEPAASDWTVTFYPDGTSDGGGVEVDEGGIQRTLVIGAKSGLSKWQDGGMPASESEKWQAGEFERRG